MYTTLQNTSFEKLRHVLKWGLIGMLSGIALCNLYAVITDHGWIKGLPPLTNLGFFIIYCIRTVIWMKVAAIRYKPKETARPEERQLNVSNVALSVLAISCIGHILFMVLHYFPTINYGLAGYTNLYFAEHELLYELIALLTTVLMIVLSIKRVNVKKGLIVQIGITLIVGLLAAWLVMTSSNDTYSVYHKTAYYYELWARENLLPYTPTTSSTYGHFGLILLPFIKILGGGYKAYNIVTGGVAFISVVLTSYAAYKLLKNKLLSYAVTFCALLPFVYQQFQRGYPQMAPHRTLLMALFMAVIAFVHTSKAGEKVKYAVRFVSTVFALLWCTETGAVYMIAMHIYEVMYAIFNEKKSAFRRAYAIFNGICALLAFIGVINIYNLFLGTTASLKTCLYPFSTNLFFAVSARVYNEYGVAQPLFFILMFIFMAGAGIYYLWKYAKNDKHEVPVVAAIGVMSIGMGYYFLVLTAFWRTLLMVGGFIMCVCWVLDNHETRETPRSVRQRMLLSVLTGLFVVTTIASAVGPIKTHIERHNQTDPIIEAAEIVKEHVPEDMYVFGYGKEIYARLGRAYPSSEDNIHVGINAPAMESVLAAIKATDRFAFIGLKNVTEKEDDEYGWAFTYNEDMEEMEPELYECFGDYEITYRGGNELYDIIIFGKEG